MAAGWAMASSAEVAMAAAAVGAGAVVQVRAAAVMAKARKVAEVAAGPERIHHSIRCHLP